MTLTLNVRGSTLKRYPHLNVWLYAWVQAKYMLVIPKFVFQLLEGVDYYGIVFCLQRS